MTTPPLTYEYAGFRYAVEFDDAGKATGVRPLPGQHPAAGREKHRRNALQSYLDDKGRFDLVRASVRATAALMDKNVPDVPMRAEPVPMKRWVRPVASEPDSTITTWRKRGAVVFNTPVPAPRLPFSPPERRAYPKLAKAQLGDDSGTSCPSCEGKMIVVGLPVHDEVEIRCSACGWPSARGLGKATLNTQTKEKP